MLTARAGLLWLATSSATLAAPPESRLNERARAAIATGARRIAVIGTEGTVRSGAYQDALRRLDPGVVVEAAPCPLLVPLAEEGWGDHPITDQVAESYLRPLLDRGITPIITGFCGRAPCGSRRGATC